MANSGPRTCIEIRQHLKIASYRVAWNTCLVCVVYGARDFDPISSSCHPRMSGWTCDPIWRRSVTTSSARTSEPQHFLLGENCILWPLLLKCAVSIIGISVTEYHIQSGSPETAALVRYVFQTTATPVREEPRGILWTERCVQAKCSLLYYMGVWKRLKIRTNSYV